MADTSDFKNGLIIKFKNDLYTIVGFQHVKPGKGGAFVRSTLKSLKTGKVLDNTFRAGEKVDTVRVERKTYQYLYKDGDFLVCMDNETYDQINVLANLFGDGVNFLKEGVDVEILFNGTEIISVEIPTGAVKSAKLETGVTINVPLFIEAGNLLKVDTRTGEYSERVKS